jgi:CRISPR-associated protein Csc2
VQGVYDHLSQGETPLEHPLDGKILTQSTQTILDTWTQKRGISMKLSSEELNDLIEDIDRHWSLEEQGNFLKRLDESYEPYRQVKAKAKADSNKGRKAKS